MTNYNFRPTWVQLIYALCFFIGTSGCLKTRAQLREDSASQSEDQELSRGTAAKPIQEVKANSQYAIDEMKSEITHLEGRIEDLERSQKELERSQKELQQKSQATPLKDPGVIEELKKLAEKNSQLEQNQLILAEALKKMQDSPPVVDAEALFNQAKANFQDEDYEPALDKFTNYLKIPKAKHTEEAIFLKGDCLYNLKHYKKAIVEFSKFPEKYPRSGRTPEALYKIALSFEGLNMKEEARGFYAELIEKHPKSPEAKRARKKLKSHKTRSRSD